jgi:hypothetical protein
MQKISAFSPQELAGSLMRLRGKSPVTRGILQSALDTNRGGAFTVQGKPILNTFHVPETVVPELKGSNIATPPGPIDPLQLIKKVRQAQLQFRKFNSNQNMIGAT